MTSNYLLDLAPANWESKERSECWFTSRQFHNRVPHWLSRIPESFERSSRSSINSLCINLTVSETSPCMIASQGKFMCISRRNCNWKTPNRTKELAQRPGRNGKSFHGLISESLLIHFLATLGARGEMRAKVKKKEPPNPKSKLCGAIYIRIAFNYACWVGKLLN